MNSAQPSVALLETSHDSDVDEYESVREINGRRVWQNQEIFGLFPKLKKIVINHKILIIITIVSSHQYIYKYCQKNIYIHFVTITVSNVLKKLQQHRQHLRYQNLFNNVKSVIIYISRKHANNKYFPVLLFSFFILLYICKKLLL